MSFVQQAKDGSQTLAHAGRHALGGQGLHRRHVAQATVSVDGEAPVPSVQVPLLPPVVQRPRDAHRVDAEGTVVEPHPIVALG